MPVLPIFLTATIVLVGAALAFQAPVNAALARSLGDPLWAAAMQFGIGFVLLGSVALSRGATPGLAELRAIPWWALTGGALGALWVLAALWSIPKLGAVTMFGAMILGQMIAALLIDATGVLGLEARTITVERLMAVGLVAAGVVLSSS
jgi:transporter family-2 protein